MNKKVYVSFTDAMSNDFSIVEDDSFSDPHVEIKCGDCDDHPIISVDQAKKIISALQEFVEDKKS